MEVTQQQFDRERLTRRRERQVEETAEQRGERLARRRERQAEETAEQRDERLARRRETQAEETAEQRDERLARQRESVKTVNKTSVNKTVIKTTNKILLNMSSTLQCPVKHTGKHQHVEQLLHV